MLKKIVKLIKMNPYEKKRSWVRNTYPIFHKNKYGSIGKKSYFLNPMFISGTPNIFLGEDVGIWDQARVEMIEKWHGQIFSPRLVIGDHSNIGQNLHLTCAERIEIEKDVVITARVTITDIIHETGGFDKTVLEQPLYTKPVKICQGAFIGINAVIMPGVTIGKHAVVGANSVVTKDVPDYAVVAGAPAKVIRERAK